MVPARTAGRTMIWSFSDGTTVELGGNVEGATLLAQRLRQELAETETLCIWPPPNDGVAFDKTDPALMDHFLRGEVDFWTRIRGLKLTLERPDDVPALPPPPWAGIQQHDPNVVY